jgi:hypothetical protein
MSWHYVAVKVEEEFGDGYEFNGKPNGEYLVYRKVDY